jgi:guanylate kinase
MEKPESLFQFVTQMNIEHFERLLAGEKEESEQTVLRRLLTEEKTKLDTMQKSWNRAGQSSAIENNAFGNMT